MLWFRKELVTVFALVLVTVRVTGWCNLTMVPKFKKVMLTGTLYKVLSTRTMTGHFEYVNTVKKKDGVSYLTIKEYNKDVLEGQSPCNVTENMYIIMDNRCISIDTDIYIIFSDRRYTVAYMHHPSYGTREDMDIYIKAFDQNTVAVGDLPTKLRRKVSRICGVDAISPDFYQTQFQVRDFIPDCLSDEP